ncbi:MAG: PEP/pyruvate-binding domain-containing protein [Myxococcota bacterium]
MLSLMVVWAAAMPLTLEEEDAARARVLVESMKNNPRGPYQRIAWFCADGSVLPPRPGACSDHGGGRQHGVLSEDGETLVALGVPVGTILAALEPSTFLADHLYRARAYLLEQYLVRTLDGWVLRRARSYRGAQQAEDEAAAADRLMAALAAEDAVIDDERPLLTRLSRVLPFGRSGPGAQAIRDLATDLSERDRGFLPLRARIHGQPSPDDAKAVKRYARTKRGGLRKDALELAGMIEAVYSPSGRRKRFEIFETMTSSDDVKAALERFLSASTATETLVGGRSLLRAAHQALPDAAPRERAALLGIMGLTDEVLAETTAELRTIRLTRREGLDLLGVALDSAHYLGVLSEREVGALRPCLNGAADHLVPVGYAGAIDYLERALEWSRARYLVDLGPALPRYQRVEPAAFGLVDELLRTGVTLPIGALLDRFATDVENLRSGGHILPELSAAGVRGENPGIGQGIFRVVRPGGASKGVERNEIILVFDSVPDLPPVAGIVTVGTPNSLSHVSLLAQNLGIPHVAVTGETAEALSRWAGEEVVLGVSESRRVALARTESLTEETLDQLAMRKDHGGTSLTIEAERLNLAQMEVLPLNALTADDAGVVVGPKAAELARLKSLFPDRVSDAFVLPFGTFLAHVTRPLPGKDQSPWDQLKAAYGKAEHLPEAAAEDFLLDELKEFRAAINTLPLQERLIRQVKEQLRRLGPENSFGIFVRSDTNVEDLENFTGAGLNTTVPNRVGLSSTLNAIRQVWASPYSERSFRWRQRILTNPEHVYPSVVVQRTVPSEISGVLVTTDLVSGDPTALTVSVSEGVAAVVDGGAAETIVARADSTTELLSSSRVYARKLIPKPPQEGIIWAPARKEEPLLTRNRLLEVTGLAREVVAAMPRRETAWDIEFGLVDNRAYLFQIRPLRPSKLASTHPFLRQLDAEARLPREPVDLDEFLP